MPYKKRTVYTAQYNEAAERAEIRRLNEFVALYQATFDVSKNDALKAILYAGVTKLQRDMKGGDFDAAAPGGGVDAELRAMIIDIHRATVGAGDLTKIDTIGLAVTEDLPRALAHLSRGVRVDVDDNEHETGAHRLRKDDPAHGGMTDEQKMQMAAAIAGDGDSW